MNNDYKLYKIEIMFAESRKPYHNAIRGQPWKDFASSEAQSPSIYYVVADSRASAARIADKIARGRHSQQSRISGGLPPTNHNKQALRDFLSNSREARERQFLNTGIELESEEVKAFLSSDAG